MQKIFRCLEEIKAWLIAEKLKYIAVIFFHLSEHSESYKAGSTKIPISWMCEKEISSLFIHSKIQTHFISLKAWKVIFTNVSYRYVIVFIKILFLTLEGNQLCLSEETVHNFGRRLPLFTHFEIANILSIKVYLCYQCSYKRETNHRISQPFGCTSRILCIIDFKCLKSFLAHPIILCLIYYHKLTNINAYYIWSWRTKTLLHLDIGSHK